MYGCLPFAAREVIVSTLAIVYGVGEDTVEKDRNSLYDSLRRAKRSDGSPILPSDVAWSLKRAATPDNGIWGFLVSAIKDVTGSNDGTIVITLNRADPSIIPHGLNGYVSWGCRCGVCRTARAAYDRANRAPKAAK